MKKINLMSDADMAVTRLAREHADWLPVLDAAAAVAAQAEPHGGEFAGAWVVDELGRRGAPRWIPNLRILVSYGLIEKSGPSTRGGRRAYYRMPLRTQIEQALEAWRAATASASRPQRTLRFVASGSASAPPTDTARRAGELDYEPRSWH